MYKCFIAAALTVISVTGCLPSSLPQDGDPQELETEFKNQLVGTWESIVAGCYLAAVNAGPNGEDIYQSWTITFTEEMLINKVLRFTDAGCTAIEQGSESDQIIASMDYDIIEPYTSPSGTKGYLVEYNNASLDDLFDGCYGPQQGILAIVGPNLYGGDAETISDSECNSAAVEFDYEGYWIKQ